MASIFLGGEKNALLFFSWSITIAARWNPDINQPVALGKIAWVTQVGWHVLAGRSFTIPQNADFLHIDIILRCACMGVGWGGVGLITLLSAHTLLHGRWKIALLRSLSCACTHCCVTAKSLKEIREEDKQVAGRGPPTSTFGDPILNILWMEEILHQLVTIRNYKTLYIMGLQWDKPSTNWCMISSIHSRNWYFTILHIIMRTVIIQTECFASEEGYIDIDLDRLQRPHCNVTGMMVPIFPNKWNGPTISEFGWSFHLYSHDIPIKEKFKQILS